MKITILNGAPEPASLDAYLARLKSMLETKGHEITQLDLRDLSLRYCIGCWVKTPGQCVSRDASIEMDRAIIQSNFTLWAAPLKVGFSATLLKMAVDKHLPLIHPYMEVAHNEAHHRKRYNRYPRVDYENLSSDRLGESSAAIRERVQAARERQRIRFGG